MEGHLKTKSTVQPPSPPKIPGSLTPTPSEFPFPSVMWVWIHIVPFVNRLILSKIGREVVISLQPGLFCWNEEGFLLFNIGARDRQLLLLLLTGPILLFSLNVSNGDLSWFQVPVQVVTL